MSELLFEIPESLSPRLRWLRQHGLTLTCVSAGRWECILNEENIGTGDTPDAACTQFCINTQLPHWNDPRRS
jgi:hypothetical protein